MLVEFFRLAAVAGTFEGVLCAYIIEELVAGFLDKLLKFYALVFVLTWFGLIEWKRGS